MVHWHVAMLQMTIQKESIRLKAVLLIFFPCDNF